MNLNKRRNGSEVNRKGDSPIRNSAEILESRVMLSSTLGGASNVPNVGRGILSEAVSLGSFKLRSHKAVAGTVGVGDSDVVYQVAITAPIDLVVSLTHLKQNDRLNLLFSDGSVINSATNPAKQPILQFTQRLDPGTYYVDIFNGINSGVGAARTPKTKRYHFRPTGNFVFSLRAFKPDSSIAPVAPVKAPGGALAPNAGFGVEPGVDTTIVKSWTDVSADPLWGANGPSPDDIKQGQNGDCYFLAALSDIARVDPGLIEQDIAPAGNGTFRVTFLSNGQPVNVTVDAQLPVDGNGNFAYASLGADNAIWVPIMEKAFCFFRDTSKPPSYQAIANGWSDEVFKDFGSTDTQVLDQSKFNTGAKVVTTITTWLGEGRMVALGTNQGPRTLHDLHMYSVVGINADGTIELRNPWGVNPPANDGGYIAITGDQALVDMGGIVSATLPIVTPNNNVPVTPTPIVTPTPQPVTPVMPPTFTTYTTILNETLGTANSFTLDDGRFADEFEVTAPADASVQVAIASNDFHAQVEISLVHSDGSTSVVATDANPTATFFAAVTFNVTAGESYLIVASPNTVGDSGTYTLNLTDGLSAPQVITPTTTITTPSQDSGYTTVYQETLGSSSSFTLQDGRFADVYVVNSTNGGDVAIAVASADFTPQMEVLEVFSDGSTSVVGEDQNLSNDYFSSVGFAADAGATYEIVVIPNASDSGSYTLNLSDGLINTQPVLPSSF